MMKKVIFLILLKKYKKLLEVLSFKQLIKETHKNNMSIDALKFGTFEQKSTTEIYNISIGYKYFCTDRQTSKDSTNGIMVYHKEGNV